MIQPVKSVPPFIVDIRNGHGRESQGKSNENSSEVESQDRLELPSKACGGDDEHCETVLLP